MMTVPVRQRRMWTCDRCGRVLGELVNGSVIIAPRPTQLYVVPFPVEARCKCGHTNVMDSDRAEEVRAA